MKEQCVQRDEGLHTALRWVNECLQGHEECANSSTTTCYPSRLLDINEVRLVLTSKELVFGPYVTLSYRWGDSPSFFTLKTENMQEIS